MLWLLVMGTRRLREPDQVLRPLHRRLLPALASLPFAFAIVRLILETALNAEETPYMPQQILVQTYATWQPQASLPGWRELGEGGTNRAYRKADTRLEPAHSNTLRA